MKHNTIWFMPKALGACFLSAALSCMPAQAQEEFEYTLKMPYSQDYLLLLRQYQGNPETEGRKGYFELYRLGLETIKNNDSPSCTQSAQALMPFAQEQLKNDTEIEIDDEHKPSFMLMKSLCTDLNQDGKDEIFLGLNSDFYFGNRHLGFFLYGESEHQTQNLLNVGKPYPGTFRGDDVRLRPGKDAKSWPDLISLSIGFMPQPGEPYEAYLSAFTYSTENKGYENGKLIYSPQEMLHETQNTPLTYSEFNSSMIQDGLLVLNRSGSLVGGLYREAFMYSTFYADALMVIESRSGRVEKAFLGDLNKSLVQGLKIRFPQYYPREFPNGGLVQFEPKILGFNQEDLIFKLDISAACLDLPNVGPCKNDGFGPNFEKKYPPRFAGYWAYHYRTGAFKLISWNSQASVNVEHPGYQMKFD